MRVVLEIKDNLSHRIYSSIFFDSPFALCCKLAKSIQDIDKIVPFTRNAKAFIQGQIYQ